MTVDFLVGFAKEAVKVSLLLSAPMLGFGLIVGLLVSIFQAVTQVQEMTLTFVPKIVAVMIAILIFLPWMLNLFVDYTRNIFINIPMYIR